MKRKQEIILPPPIEGSKELPAPVVKVPSSIPPTFDPYDTVQYQRYLMKDVSYRCQKALSFTHCPWSRTKRKEFVSRLTLSERQSFVEFLEALYDLKMRRVFYGDEIRVHYFLVMLNELRSHFQNEMSDVSDFLSQLKDQFIELVEHASRETRKES